MEEWGQELEHFPLSAWRLVQRGTMWWIAVNNVAVLQRSLLISSTTQGMHQHGYTMLVLSKHRLGSVEMNAWVPQSSCWCPCQSQWAHTSLSLWINPSLFLGSLLESYYDRVRLWSFHFLVIKVILPNIFISSSMPAWCDVDELQPEQLNSYGAVSWGISSAVGGGWTWLLKEGRVDGKDDCLSQ